MTEAGKYEMFRNRLEKVWRHLSKTARRQGISCFRLYHLDLPEFPLSIEWYEGHVYVAEYLRRHKMNEEAHAQWLANSSAIIAEVLQIPGENVFVKLRRRKAGRLGQYKKADAVKHEFVVRENGLQFIVNMSDYLDTGLFLDHRITRRMVMEVSNNKKVLNLFAYTGSFSVYAAAGGASKVTTVDLSKTYLAQAEKNMQLNAFWGEPFEYVHADVLQFIKSIPPRSYDLIILDPPTFSNSKRMDGILDIQQDHAALVNDCLKLLLPGGVIFFSTNYSRFQLQADTIKAASIKDITKMTTPFDFAGKLTRWCYKIS